MDNSQNLDCPIHSITDHFSQMTGLKTTVLFGPLKNGTNTPYLKVSNTVGGYSGDDGFVVSVSENPEVLTPNKVELDTEDVGLVLLWVKINYFKLMQIWDMNENDYGDQIEVWGSLEKIKH